MKKAIFETLFLNGPETREAYRMFHHFGVRVTDMNAAIELLKNNGVIFTKLDGTPVPEPDPQFIQEANYFYCFLLGPSGERIEIIQRL